jgi:hypothetical protein
VEQFIVDLLQRTGWIAWLLVAAFVIMIVIAFQQGRPLNIFGIQVGPPPQTQATPQPDVTNAIATANPVQTLTVDINHARLDQAQVQEIAEHVAKRVQEVNQPNSKPPLKFYDLPDEYSQRGYLWASQKAILDQLDNLGRLYKGNSWAGGIEPEDVVNKARVNKVITPALADDIMNTLWLTSNWYPGISNWLEGGTDFDKIRTLIAHIRYNLDELDTGWKPK